MNQALVDKIADAVLYEGYILYPYRPSVKNRQRWQFGGLCPPSYSLAHGGTEACTMQAECLVEGNWGTVLEVKVRFLHLLARSVGELTRPLAELPADGELDFRVVETLQVGGQDYYPWQEALERTISVDGLTLNELVGQARVQWVAFPEHREPELLRCPTGEVVGVVVREQQGLDASVEVSAEPAAEGLFQVRVRIHNRTPLADAGQQSRDDALLRSLVSTHIILGVRGGEFVSLLDPPLPWRDIAAGCRNEGVWPVLVGTPGARDTMLASPIILGDYPQVAPESPGDLFDATEIDEILTLRILALSDAEKQAMTAVDGRARALLHRTAALTEDQLRAMHGTMRPVQPPPMSSWDPLAAKPGLDRVRIGGVDLEPGTRVRLRPRGRADIFDLALDGKTATIAAIEQDFEDRVYLAVTVDDDPGKDFGELKQPGHRFFFGVEEIEPLSPADESCAPKVTESPPI